MLNTHCGKHNKLSKTMVVTIGLNGRNKVVVTYTAAGNHQILK